MRPTLKLLLPAVLLSSVFSIAAAGPDLEEQAMEALANGREARAVRLLERAVAGASDAERDALSCLLGRAKLLAGDPTGAAAVLAGVDAGAECALQASFDRADALEALGDDDALAEAAALYAAAGAGALGEERDAALVERLLSMARETLEAPDGDRSRALQVYTLALGLQLPEATRREIAREIARSADELPLPDLNPTQAPTAALLGALYEADELDDRLLLARLLSPDYAPAVLADADRGAAVLGALAEAAERLGDEAWTLAGLRLLAAFPESEEATALAPRLSLRLANTGRLDLAQIVLDDAAPEVLDSDEAAMAAWTIASRWGQAGDYSRSRALMEAWLERYPTHHQRREAERRIQELDLDLARAFLAGGEHHLDTLARYDALVARDPKASVAPTAAYEAGLTLQSGGDHEQARRRWEEVMARWPDSSEARMALRSRALSLAFDAGEPEAAMAWVKHLEEQGPMSYEASTLRALLQEPSVDVASTDRAPSARDAAVRVVTRNLETLEVRLHAIEPEAYLRAGGTPTGLQDLDVGVIAPDKVWTVDVPDYRPYEALDFELPVDVPGPGIYAVTTASPTEEATAILLVSDLTLAARVHGPDLAVATFRDGQPAGNAQVWVRDGSEVIEARTDGRGLLMTEVETGELVVLAERGGHPAMLRLDRDVYSLQSGTLETSLELDRPIYKPGGDELSFRAVGREAGEPLRGEWTFWIEGYEHQAISVKADRRGAVTGSLPLPPHAVSAQLYGSTPGSEVSNVHRQITIQHDEGAPHLSLDVEQDGLVRLHGPDGAPSPGRTVRWRDGLREGEQATDETGALLIEGPPAGLPWTLTAEAEGWSSASRLVSPLQPPTLRLNQPLLRPEQAGELTLTGPAGEVEVELIRWLELADRPEVPTDPWSPSISPGFEVLTTPFDPTRSREAVVSDAVIGLGALTLEEDTPLSVTLPALETGRYTARVRRVDGGELTRSLSFAVNAEAARVTGAAPRALGQRLDLTAEGDAALVTVEGYRMLAAAVLRDGQQADWEVRADWDGEARVRGLFADGTARSQTVTFDGSLDVDVSVEALTTEEGPRWRVRASVKDGEGRPVRAQVALSALDTVLLESAYDPSQLHGDLFVPDALSGSGQSAAALSLRHAAWGQPVADALLAEAAREAEARRAQSAESGVFESTMEQAMLEADYMLIGNTSGLGSGGAGYGAGYGAGATGYGSGSGGVGVRAARYSGERDRVLWTVLETDRAGVVEYTTARPHRPATWRVQATALSEAATGRDAVEVVTGDAPYLLVHAPPNPGMPGESAAPEVTVVNGGSEALTAALTVSSVAPSAAGDSSEALTLAPGEVRRLTLPAQPAGAALAVSLVRGQERLDSADWRFPLASSTPHPSGRVLEVAVDADGAPPIAELALAADPLARWDGVRAIRDGRVALAALDPQARPDRLDRLPKADADALRARAEQRRHLQQNLSQPVLPRERAEALIFMAEVDDATDQPMQSDLDSYYGLLRATTPDPADRAYVTWAIARAGFTPEASTLERLLREAPALSDEDASLLARTLHALGRRDEARAMVRGDGVHAVLARRALGLNGAPLTTPPPAVGDAGRADWLRAMDVKTPRQLGEAAVTLSGELVGTLPLTSGGRLRLVLPEGASLDDVAVSAGAAVLWRSGPPPSHSPPPRALRLPATGELPAPNTNALVRLPGLGDALDMDATDQTFCGDARQPCQLTRGDRLVVSGVDDRPGWTPPGGLTMERGARALTLRAEVMGDFTLDGLSDPETGDPIGPLSITVGEAPATPAQISRPIALGLALTGDREPLAAAAWLAPWPDESDWAPAQLPARAGVRFEAALVGDDPQTLVERFEELRDLKPDADLDFESVRAVAEAYDAVGRPDRSLAVWRAGLGAAFLAQAGSARELESSTGLLASLRELRWLTARYPSVPAVEEASFLLNQRVAAMAEQEIPYDLARAGVTATDLRLTAAAWDQAFLALHPDAPQAPHASFQYVQSLMALRAWSRAADAAAWFADRYPESDVLDGLVYLEGVARAELGQDDRALKHFERIAEEDFPLGGGRLGAAPSRDDARYAAARLHEARGNLEAAREGYETVSSTGRFPEAARSLNALTRVRLEPDPLVTLSPMDSLSVPALVTNLDEVFLRAYRVDLRTIFLRDYGLDGVHDIAISGVSPAWSGRQVVDAGPFPREVDLTLPLDGAGAWLVQINGGGVESSALVVRSALEMTWEDSDRRRLWVLRDGAPAAGVQIRALGGPIVAETTDLRGVALVPAGAQALAFDGEHYAFTPTEASYSVDYSRAPQPEEDLMMNMRSRLEAQQSSSQGLYESNFDSASPAAVKAYAM